MQSASDRCHLNVPLSTLGPSVVIFHETQHTEILGEGAAPIADVEPFINTPSSPEVTTHKPQAEEKDKDVEPSSTDFELISDESHGEKCNSHFCIV